MELVRKDSSHTEVGLQGVRNGLALPEVQQHRSKESLIGTPRRAIPCRYTDSATWCNSWGGWAGRGGRQGDHSRNSADGTVKAAQPASEVVVQKACSLVRNRLIHRSCRLCS